MSVCKLKFERTSRDFVFAVVSKITWDYSNLTTCPILPGFYSVWNVTVDSKNVPGFVSVPDQNLILGARYCRKLKKQKDLCFVNGVAKFRWKN